MYASAPLVWKSHRCARVSFLLSANVCVCVSLSLSLSLSSLRVCVFFFSLFFLSPDD